MFPALFVGAVALQRAIKAAAPSRRKWWSAQKSTYS
jgi:hypothetical protein